MIAAYGKLPISKEYLRHNCHDGIALRFREWMDSGFDYAGSRGLVGRKAHSHRVYYCHAASETAAQAVAIPSKDASGSREFPFALLSIESVLPNGFDFFSLCEERWEELERQLERLCSESDTDSFFETVRGIALETERSAIPDEVSAEPVSWIERLYRYDPVDMFVRALWRLRVVQPLLGAATPELLRVRVPIDRSSTPGPQIDRWRTILSRLHPTYSTAPSLFCPAPVVSEKPKPAGAWLIFGEPRAADFGAAIGGRLEDGVGIDLVDNEGRLPVDGFGAFRERLEGGPLRAASTIDELLAFDLLV